MLLLALLACADASKDDSLPVGGDDTSSGGNGGGCIDPTATILEPAEGASITFGGAVALRGEVESGVTDAAHMQLLWGVDDDTIGTGLEETWTPAASGTYLIRFQATDECGTGQDQVTVTVSEVGG